ncbi:hypothetical protein M422DRAFT_160624 [Sphaerobolus stellatus SS14]|nr:hypothetical protein M422DRAFT_160624 [Sphaerobolus stellatus SS14]
MERVEFQQEDMLAELKDLEEKGLFSKSEVKMIMKKRTAFEASLVRRIPKKADFLRYAEYEMSLEALRRRRAQRTKAKDTTLSLSDYAMVRRQFYIFERALRKFKADVGLWVQYIELAKKEHATALVGRISARQLHPNEPALYVYAAQHEMSNMSPAAARALLQRGLRLNKDTEMLWTEYVKFELGFVEVLRKRWKALGVTGAGEDEGEEARKEILQGGIVRAVLDEAVKAKPAIGLFKSLHEMLASYPTPLREDMLEHLHGLLTKTLPGDAEALRLRARYLLREEDEDSEEFVDKLRAGNEELLGQAREHRGAVSGAYAEVIAGWCKRDLEPSLRQYLIACLQSLTALKDVAPELLATHVRLLSADAEGLGRAVTRARKYTAADAAGGRDAAVWLARLDAERLAGTGTEEITRTWAEARRRVMEDSPRGEAIWRWGLEQGSGMYEVRSSLYIADQNTN